ncbi:hypothetical protein BCR39DRAFT_586293 [Naematelia encephala]|uniref:Uncharacterized protein n=1 Tax=Naematelia encephala TaxID=71784 RepID=A0A1Y2BH34_9TREE|nr:hypothetical protein BCR39DRAFT_586293 [Naematelia encephala]
MPSLSAAAKMSETPTTSTSKSTTSTKTSSASPSSITPYSYATSDIVKVTVAAGVIVLVLSALVFFFKISSWIQYHRRLSRQRHLTTLLATEQRANVYEIAAWSDEPGTAPVRTGIGGGVGGSDRKSRKEIREEVRAFKRGGANAHAVHEWEGVPA